ncbi:MAG: hypothetical protein IT340_19965 [Chloroflexi bacterium]|nr:hypothetical protein [Chloroflexota bacterium]
MAGARVDNGQPYDATEARSRPGGPADITLRPTPEEASRLHEVPVYFEVNEAEGWGFSIHGPQDPRFVGGQVGKPLGDPGINPVTGAARWSPVTVKTPIPFIHTVLFEVARDGVVYRFVGGVRIHQVALPGPGDVWYLKTWVSPLAADGASGSYVGRHLEITGKIIFVPRSGVDEAGNPTTLSEITSQAAGGPSMVHVRNNGHPDYPAGLRVSMRLRGTRYNSGVHHEYPHNRYGFLTLPHADMRDVVPGAGRDSGIGLYGNGDDLADADVPATGHR